jgi:benzoyl-CoA reductase/2-hydroxyglutaryl-CoA dehydratase subunit BcrC/BadD/HgdB
MWDGLGLDLEAHDALLGVLSNAYQEIYLAQTGRPEAMGYFDFVMSEVHGLRIKELLEEKAAGRKIVGSYCVFVPEEIVLAANATLVGLCSGADFATEDVEKLLPRNTCALIKSSFETMMEAIVDRYFQVDCAIFTPNTERLNHIQEMVDTYRADGVIHYGLQFCQTYLMEAIPVEKALEEKNIPCLRIETDYGMEDAGQLKTRVEAFIEQLR